MKKQVREDKPMIEAEKVGESNETGIKGCNP